MTKRTYQIKFFQNKFGMNFNHLKKRGIENIFSLSSILFQDIKEFMIHDLVSLYGSFCGCNLKNTLLIVVFF